MVQWYKQFMFLVLQVWSFMRQLVCSGAHRRLNSCPLAEPVELLVEQHLDFRTVFVCNEMSPVAATQFLSDIYTCGRS